MTGDLALVRQLRAEIRVLEQQLSTTVQMCGEVAEKCIERLEAGDIEGASHGLVILVLSGEFARRCEGESER